MIISLVVFGPLIFRQSHSLAILINMGMCENGVYSTPHFCGHLSRTLINQRRLEVQYLILRECGH